jgi:hypothetical protein
MAVRGPAIIMRQTSALVGDRWTKAAPIASLTRILSPSDVGQIAEGRLRRLQLDRDGQRTPRRLACCMLLSHRLPVLSSFASDHLLWLRTAKPSTSSRVTKPQRRGKVVGKPVENRGSRAIDGMVGLRNGRYAGNVKQQLTDASTLIRRSAGNRSPSAPCTTSKDILV